MPRPGLGFAVGGPPFQTPCGPAPAAPLSMRTDRPGRVFTQVPKRLYSGGGSVTVKNKHKGDPAPIKPWTPPPPPPPDGTPPPREK
ncbi:hypothetical protein GCM10009574_098570 [Streptomyces asiaticus]|uniref:Uncharacterized protein n=2 Tax=Streptomyces rhizosphaericus TaxID=114699 RepID=A0ABP3ZAG8_9ACTN